MTSSADDLRAWDAVAESYAADAERDRRFGPFLWRHLGLAAAPVPARR